MRGRRVGEEIVVVDPLCYEFIDCKGHAPDSRFAPVAADRPRQVVGGGQGRRAVAQSRLIGNVGGEPRRQRQGVAPQRLGLWFEIGSAFQRRAAHLGGRGIDRAQQRGEIGAGGTRQAGQIAADGMNGGACREPLHFFLPPGELQIGHAGFGRGIHERLPLGAEGVDAEQGRAHLRRGEQPTPIAHSARRHRARPVGRVKGFQSRPHPMDPVRRRHFAGCARDSPRARWVRSRGRCAARVPRSGARRVILAVPATRLPG